MSVHSVELVREFHAAFGHPIKEVPGLPSFELRKLRIRLILEELIEFIEASGFLSSKILPMAQALDVAIYNFTENQMVDERLTTDITGAADALGDLDYVVQGANLVWGFPAVSIIYEIHCSNMSKLGEDGKPLVREDGKILKGPNYEPPNIRDILLRTTGLGRDFLRKEQRQLGETHFASHPNSDHP